MANDFCRRLSNSARFILNPGDGLSFQPCCWVPTSNVQIVDKKTIMLAREDSTRMVMSDTAKFCAECLHRERNQHNMSHRISAQRFIPEDAVDHDVYELVVQVDNTCNAACVMCGPQFSSLWGRQLDTEYRPTDVSGYYDLIIESVDLSNLSQVTLIGGEPFLSEHNFRLLEEIPNPGEVTIHINTNASVYPSEEKLAMLKRFKKVLLGLSIDGTGEQFEYIRWPLGWRKVSDNVARFRDAFGSGLRGGMSVNFTVNPMNIVHYQDVVEWFKPYQPEVADWQHVYASVCYGDWGLDATPQRLRTWVDDNLGEDHALAGMLRAHPEVPGKFDALVERMKELDWTRGLSHELTFNRTLSIL